MRSIQGDIEGNALLFDQFRYPLDTADGLSNRLNELGFLSDDDPRFVGTVRAIGRELKR